VVSASRARGSSGGTRPAASGARPLPRALLPYQMPQLSMRFDAATVHAMPAITIGNVPDEVRDELAARAARAGRSLQEHLRLELIEMAGRPDNAELMRRIRERKSRYGIHLTGDEIIAAIHEEREAR
jgi:hypothetical protein